MRSRIGALAVWGLLPAVVLAGFARLLQSPDSLVVDSRKASIDYARKNPERSLGNDLTTVFLPRFVLIRDQVKLSGTVPLWDASGFGGRPLLGNPQAGLLYPPFWLALLNGNLASLGWLTVGHLIWAGVGVFLLGRSTGLSRSGSVLAGVCFELSPFLLGHTFEGHYPHVWSACWYPWAFRAMILATRGNCSGILFCPLILALCIVCGHPQEWYYLVLALSVWWLIVHVPAFRAKEFRLGLMRILLWAIILFVSVAVVAIDVLPQRETGFWTLRTGEIPLRFINRYQLRPENLLQLFSPFALGRPHDYFGHDNYWECLLSAGFCPLILAAIGVIRYPDRRLVRSWGTLVLLALIFATGRKLGLFSIAYLILPGMERFRVPSRSLFLAALGVSMLAGSGVDVLLRARFEGREGKALRLGIVLSLASIGVLIVGVSRLGLPLIPAGHIADARGVVLTHDQGPAKDETAALFRLIQGARRIASEPAFAATLGGVLLVLSIPWKSPWSRFATAYGIGAIATCELVLYAHTLLVCSPAERFTHEDRVSQSIRRGEPQGMGPLRVAAVESRYDDLSAVLSGVEKTNINDGFQLQHAADLYERLYPFLDPAPTTSAHEHPMDGPAREYQKIVARHVLNLMGVRAFVTDRLVPWNDLVKGETIASEQRSVTVWKNPSALPLAYMVPRAFLRNHELRLPVEEMLRVDPHDAVILAIDPLDQAEGQAFVPASWTRDEGDVVGLEVETTAPGFLVIANTWMPGWTAELDGLPAIVLRGNHCQQVIAIDKSGAHSITLRYTPPGLVLGSMVSASTLLGWLLGVFLWRRHFSKNQTDHNDDGK